MDKLLHCSDLHGSSLCFNKLISTAVAFEVGVIVIAGDLTGKTLTPIVRKASGVFEGFLAGKLEHVEAGNSLELLLKDIENSGIAQDAGNRKLQGEPIAPVHLYGIVRRSPGHSCRQQLGHAGFKIASAA